MANLLNGFVVALVVCELQLGLLCGTATAQTFTVQPTDVDLTPGQDTYQALTCSFTKASQSDVIGWVVNGIRISNNDAKDTDAITQALGPEAGGKIQLFVNEIQETNNIWNYEIDFFAATEVLLGGYMCQLCTDATCNTVLAESNTAQVSIEYEPTSPPVCRPTVATRVVLGESATLYCTSDPGIPTVRLEWLRNTQVMSGQAQPVLSNGLLFQNHTFVPGVTDDDPGVAFYCRMTSANNEFSCSITPFILVSTPHVSVIPPSQGIAPGSSGTYTCAVTSDTNTPISEYMWDIPDVPSSRLTYSNNGLSVTISDITAADHEKVIECVVTDAQSMQGSGRYLILVEGEVIPSNLPTIPSVLPTQPVSPGTSTASPGPAGISTPAIIAIAVVGFILLCILLGGLWFCCNKHKHGKHTLPPTIVRNNLSPTAASPYKSEKAFNYSNVDAKQPEPDVIPKGPNERPVDVDSGEWWKGSDAPNGHMTAMQHANPNDDPYKYNPAYDDKADPAELDLKVPLDDPDYGTARYGYSSGDNYGYPNEQNSKYNDTHYIEDGYNKQEYPDREYGDGRQDSYPQGYGDEYNQDLSNYDTVYADGHQAPEAQYGSGYDPYPDRMPDGSEGYDPPPEYNGQAYDGYGASTDYGRPDDYNAVGDYNNQPHDMGYEDQPAEYHDEPSNYNYQDPTVNALPDTYNDGGYGDQYNAPYDAERIPDGGAPEGGDYESYNYPPESEPYGHSYNDDLGHYNEAGYASSSYQHDPSYAQGYSDQYQGIGQPQSESYYDPEEEVSANSNPSYV